MERPMGITILAILNFLGGLLAAGGAALMFVGGAYLGTMLAGAAAESGEAAAGAGLMGMVAGFSAIIGGVLLVFAFLYFALGYGLWTLKNWARIITIVFTGLSAALGLLGLLGSLMTGEIASIVVNLVFLAIYGWVLWYLFQEHVKDAFAS